MAKKTDKGKKSGAESNGSKPKNTTEEKPQSSENWQIVECPHCKNQDPAEIRFVDVRKERKNTVWTYECTKCHTVFRSNSDKVVNDLIIKCPKCESTAINVKQTPLIYKYQCRKCRKVFAAKETAVIAENPLKSPKKRDKVEVGKVTTTRRRAEFAKKFAVTGDKRKALEASGTQTDYPAQAAHKLLADPAVTAIINRVREQLRDISPLSNAEIKQLASELAMVSVVDLLEPNGSFDIEEVKKKNLGRFIKELEIEEKWDSEQGTVRTYKIKGYSRLDALKLLSTINQDEENKDLLIVQAICHLLSLHENLNNEQERERIFNAFAARYRQSIETIRENFRKFAPIYLPSRLVNPVQKE